MMRTDIAASERVAANRNPQTDGGATAAHGRQGRTDAGWPDRFRPVLGKLTAEGPRYFGFEVLRVEAVRQIERPFSTVLQIRAAGERETASAFVKLLKPRQDTPAETESMRQNAVKDFEMTTRVFQGLVPYPGLTAVRPLACFPQDLAIVTEEAPGSTLAQLLRAAHGWPGRRRLEQLIASVRQAGAWVKAVQTALPQDVGVTADNVRSYFDRRLNELEAADPMRLSRSGRQRLEDHREYLISRALAEARAEAFHGVWIHADFCPENLIIRDGHLTVLDFTMAKTGTVYHDVSHLYLWLESMTAKPWFRPHVVAVLQRELLDAFESGLTPDRPLFRLMLLQHVLCHLLGIRLSTRRSLSGLYAARLHARHRQWLAAEAGLAGNDWRR